MVTCPSCRRPVAVARPTCLYCGAARPTERGSALPAAAEGPRAEAAPEDAPARVERSLVVVDLTGATLQTLVHALSLPSYEAALLARRGGLHLHRALDPATAEAEAARLETEGLAAVVVPETEARSRPVRALGGERDAGSLALRTEDGPLVVARGQVLLVVRGPIAREYQPSFQRRRIQTARLEEGYRVHLHLRAPAGPRPVEIDAAHFEFGFAVTGSARLELDSWVEAVAGNAPRDDGFRRLPPALGPAEPEPKGAVSAAASLGRTSRDAADAPVVLDNVEQFRFYSGWRAAVERRR